MNRKGLIYMLLVSLFIDVFLTIFLTYNVYEFRDKQDILEVRIRTMDNFIEDFHQDVHRATYITSFRSLIALEEYIARHAVFFVTFPCHECFVGVYAFYVIRSVY